MTTKTVGYPSDIPGYPINRLSGYPISSISEKPGRLRESQERGCDAHRRHRSAADHHRVARHWLELQCPKKLEIMCPDMER